MAVRNRRSSGQAVRRPAKVLIAVACRLFGASVIVVIGGTFIHPADAVILAVILVAAYPVVTFTRSQNELTKKGTELARTIPEITALKQSDAEAFTVFFTGRGPVNGSQPPRSLQGNQPPQIPAWLPTLPASTRDFQRHPHMIRGIGQAGAGRARHQSTPRWPTGARQTRLPGIPPERWSARTDAATRTDAAGNSSLSFCLSLTGSQRDSLILRGRRKSFAPGEILCHQGGPADHVILIMSGRVRVFVDDPGGRRLIAERGPGDVVGERAAFRARPRSATIIAVEPVQALIVSTRDFTSFVTEHPAVLELVEQQIYDRLAEGGSFSCPPGSAAWVGQNCSILFTDIAGFASVARDDHDRQVIRRVLYGILITAFDAAGIPWSCCHHEDRGDGVLIIVPPEIPTGWIVQRIVGHLATALRRHNRAAEDATRIQLRAALNVGPILSDTEGVCGQAVNHAARLLDAAPLKKKLAETRADLAFIASEFVFDNVIRHIPGLDDRTGYWRVSFRAKESRITAWVQLK